MDGNIGKKGEPVYGEYMQKVFETRPRFRFKQHLLAVGIVFGLTMSSMYLMRENVEETMPWKAKKKTL